MGSQIGVDRQDSGLVRTDAVIAQDEKVGRDHIGSKTHLVAPRAGDIDIAVGTDLDCIVHSGIKFIQRVGVRGDINETGLVAIQTDLPFVGRAGLRPAQRGGSRADV